MSIQFLKLEIGLTKDNLNGEKSKGGKKGRKMRAGARQGRERKQFYCRASEKLRNCTSGYKDVIG